MLSKKKWQKIGRWVYGVVGATATATVIWAGFKIADGTFFSSMKFFGSLAFFILAIGGLNWGVKAIFNKDLFLN